jgi:hypothetical protein
VTRASVTKVWSGYIGGVINSRLRGEGVHIYGGRVYWEGESACTSVRTLQMVWWGIGGNVTPTACTLKGASCVSKG